MDSLWRAVPAAILPVLLCGCSDNHHSRITVDTVTSPARAYPLAQRMQMELAPLTLLNNVVVTWDRERKDFKIHKVTYNFAFTGHPGLAVSMDNSNHTAYVETNAPGALSNPDELAPVDFSGKDAQEILQIALHDSLGSFCASVPPGNETLLFQLQNSGQGPTWHITGFGTDTQGALIQVRMDIEADSGKVLSRSLTSTPAPK